MSEKYRSPKLRELTLFEREDFLSHYLHRSKDDLSPLKFGGLTIDTANQLIENVVGLFALPLALAQNFLIDGKDYLIPMCSEESSIVAGSSKAAKIMREAGGITTKIDNPIATGQIQLILKSSQAKNNFGEIIDKHKPELIEFGNQVIPSLLDRGGGIKDIYARPIIDTRVGHMLIVHVDIDTRDAMGANIVNSVVEHLSPELESITHSRANLKILTNLTAKRLSRACVSIPTSRFSKNTLSRFIEAQVMAEVDPYRAATHNKGIFNGIDAVALATGNDTRAIEAGGHAYAARSGTYSALTNWDLDQDQLSGKLELPLAVGTVGGLTKIHPVAQLSLEILGISTSQELASIMVSAGLAQNFAALLALVTTGIQAAHLPLHHRLTTTHPNPKFDPTGVSLNSSSE